MFCIPYLFLGFVVCGLKRKRKPVARDVPAHLRELPVRADFRLSRGSPLSGQALDLFLDRVPIEIGANDPVIP